MEIRLKKLLHTPVMAIEILLNQVFRQGPLVFKSLCISVQAWLNGCKNGNEQKQAEIHTFLLFRCCPTLLLLSQAAHFVLPDTATPAGMRLCRAEVAGSIFTCFRNQNLVLLTMQARLIYAGIKGLVLLYLWYLVLQTTACPVEANSL